MRCEGQNPLAAFLEPVVDEPLGRRVEPVMAEFGPSARFRAFPLDLTLTAFQTFQGNFKTNLKFWLWGLVATSTGSFRSTLRDAKTRQALAGLPVDSTTLFGTSQRPFYLPSPQFFWASSVLQATIKDTSGAGNTVQLTLLGAVYA